MGEAGVGHAGRGEHDVSQHVDERLAGGGGDDLGQHEVAEVGVAGRPADRVLDGAVLGEEAGEEGRGVGRVLGGRADPADGERVGKPGRVVEELADHGLGSASRRGVGREVVVDRGPRGRAGRGRPVPWPRWRWRSWSARTTGRAVSADAGRRRRRSAQPDPPAYSKAVEVVTASDTPGMRPSATSSASRSSSGWARSDLFEGAFGGCRCRVHWSVLFVVGVVPPAVNRPSCGRTRCTDARRPPGRT